MFATSVRLHLAKTMSWRILATLTTIGIAWVIVGDWRIGFQVGLVEFIVKMVLYYVHERVWYRTVWMRSGEAA